MASWGEEMMDQILGWQLLMEPDTASQLYRIYLGGTVLVAVAIAVKFWRAMGLTSKRTFAVLEEAFGLISKGNLSEGSLRLQKLRLSSPEAGLRGWVSLPAGSDRVAFLRVLHTADMHFQHVLSRAHAAARVLSALFVMTLLLSFTFMARKTYVLFAGLSAEKQHGSGVVYQALSETIYLLYVCTWVLILIYALYRHFLERMAGRRSYWEFFCSHVKNTEF